jgi:hypothetical protein
MIYTLRIECMLTAMAQEAFIIYGILSELWHQGITRRKKWKFMLFGTDFKEFNEILHLCRGHLPTMQSTSEDALMHDDLGEFYSRNYQTSLVVAMAVVVVEDEGV